MNDPRSEKAAPDPSDAPRPLSDEDPEAEMTSGKLPDQIKDLLFFLPRLAALLAKLIADPEVAATDKVLLGAAVLYVMSPIDLLPDIIPVVGQLDDIYLVALCLLRLLNHSGEEKLRQHWDGPEDIVKVLNTITDYSTRYLPAPLRGAVRGWVEARSGDVPPGSA
jgi:uncharacterized membrane protein YkvA (DUF1232 family)